MPGKPETQTLSLSLRMARAYRFAELQRWREAEQELSPAGGLPPENLALHALAAVVTQSGDYARALYLWKQFLLREPMHEEAMRMVDAIALWQSRPNWYRYLPLAAGAAAALLLIPLLVWAFSPATPARPAPRSTAPAAIVSPLPQAAPTRQSLPARPLPTARPSSPAVEDSPSIVFPKPKPAKR